MICLSSQDIVSHCSKLFYVRMSKIMEIVHIILFPVFFFHTTFCVPMSKTMTLCQIFQVSFAHYMSWKFEMFLSVFMYSTSFASIFLKTSPLLTCVICGLLSILLQNHVMLSQVFSSFVTKMSRIQRHIGGLILNSNPAFFSFVSKDIFLLLFDKGKLKLIFLIYH